MARPVRIVAVDPAKGTITIDSDSDEPYDDVATVTIAGGAANFAAGARVVLSDAEAFPTQMPWFGFPGGYDNWRAMQDHLQKLRGRKLHGFPVR